MGTKYLDEGQRDELKAPLYDYLRDKAKRRAEATSSGTYEEIQKQLFREKARSDKGALIGGLLQDANNIGTLGGKAAESTYGDFNDQLNKSGQQLYQNYRQLRGDEEQANMNDLRTADYLTQLDQKDEDNQFRTKSFDSAEKVRELQRQKLQRELQAKAQTKRSFVSGVAGPGGRPVVMGPDGEMMAAPGSEGMTLRERPMTPGRDSYQRTNVLDANGLPLNFNAKTNEYSQGKFPAGAHLPKKAGGRQPPGEYDGIAKNFESDYAKKTQIGQMLDREVAEFDRLVAAGNKDGAVRHGEGMLKAVNAAFGADAVGVQEAETLGGFLQAFKMPWKPGSTFGRDLDMFSQQVKDKSSAIKNAANDSLRRSQELRRGKLEAGPSSGAAPPPSQAGAAGPDEVQVSNGKDPPLFIPKADLPAAIADGYQEVK